MANFGMSIGFYGRGAIAANVIIYLVQMMFFSGEIHVALVFGFNYQSIVSANQYYRILTAAFSHAGFAHILFNMCWLAIFSVRLERVYGTYFFMIVNLWLMALSSALELLYDHVRVFWLPESLGGGALELLVAYSVGYSAVLFGLVMLECLSGDKHLVIYGCKVRKILLPFAYLFFSQIIVPNASLIGHLSGIISALILRYGGMYMCRLLPQYTWLEPIESAFSASRRELHKKLGYFYATAVIEKDFALC